MKIMRCAFLTSAALLAVQLASGYVRNEVSPGVFIHRTDFANIQFYANQNIAPGLNNATGHPFITADSDPTAALKAALATWSSVPTSAVKFVPLKMTALVNDSSDMQHTIVFRDTPEIQSAVGPTRVAITVYAFQADGTLLDTDIIFNPADTFSTTLAPGTYDIQATATHELGHSLGANHTGVLSATMFQSAAPGTNLQSQLSSDDIAFVSTAYPAPGPSPYGTITGVVTSSAGAPLRGALVTAVDKDTGVIIGGLSSLTDGTFSFQTPAGHYQVYVEPLTGNVKPGNLSLTSAQVDTNFQPTFLGGNDNPSSVTVTAGSRATANIAAIAGASTTQIQFTAVSNAGGMGDSVIFFQGSVIVPSGGAIDLLIVGPGLDDNLTDQNIKVLGPGVAVRPGSVRIDTSEGTINGLRVLRMTLDVAARTSTVGATLFINKGGNSAALSGGLILTPPTPVITRVQDGAAGQTNIAPGTWIAIKGTNLSTHGVSDPIRVWAAADFNGNNLPTSLDGTSVMVNNKPAFIYFVRYDQVNVLTPADTATGSVPVTVTLNGQNSQTFMVNMQSVAPGFFALPGSTTDDGKYAVAQHFPSYSLVGRTGLYPSLPNLTTPAKPGEIIIFYGNGFGATNPVVPNGQLPTVANLVTTPSMTIGNIAVVPSFAGINGIAGVYQFNVTLPSPLADGDQPIVVQANGVMAQTFITIKN